MEDSEGETSNESSWRWELFKMFFIVGIVLWGFDALATADFWN